MFLFDVGVKIGKLNEHDVLVQHFLILNSS